MPPIGPRIGTLVAALALGSVARAGAEPLDPFDPTPRQILVQQEISSDLDLVGVAYGPPVAASYSASGGIGTVTIPVASHEELRSGGLEPIPGTFTQVVIAIDLADLGAASQTASGALQSGGLSASFVAQPGRLRDGAGL
jgi:hypothetical protein